MLASAPSTEFAPQRQGPPEHDVMNPHIPQGAIKPASSAGLPTSSTGPNSPSLPNATAIQMLAEDTIAMGNIVYESGRSGNQTQVTRADADSAASIRPPLYVAQHASVSGSQIVVHPGPVFVPMDTSAGAEGDYVYVSNTAGGKSLSAGTLTQIIGRVTKAATVANGGGFTFYGSMAAAGGSSIFSAIDLNGTLDQDTTLTGTGDATNISVTMSHATQSAEALDVSIAQITNARTSGDLVAIKASVTSLTGSSTGVDHVCYDAAFTAGDADSDHIALRVGAGASHTIDSRAQTTGQNKWEVGDNLASALDVTQASSSYIKVVTTNNSEHVEIRSPRPVGPTATAITGATALTIADSGRVFTVAQSSAYDVDLPAPGDADVSFLLQLVSPGAFNVTVTVAGAAATFEGVIVNDVTSVVPATGSTLTFVSGTAVLGDCIEVRSTSSSKYFVRAISSAAGGITIA